MTRVSKFVPYLIVPVCLFTALAIYTWVKNADERGDITVWSASYYFERGAAAQRAGALDSALYEYRRALSRTPDLPEVYYNMAIVYAAKGDKAQAFSNATQAVETARELVSGRSSGSRWQRLEMRAFLYRTLSFHAYLAEDSGDLATAESDLKEVVERDGKFGNDRTWASVRLVRLALKRGAIDEARERLKPLLAESPQNVIFRFELAQIDAAAGDETDTMAELSFVIDNAKEAIESMFLIDQGARVVIGETKYSPFDDVISGSEVRRAWVEALAMRAKIHLSHNLRGQAIADLDAATKLAPNRTDIKALRSSLD